MGDDAERQSVTDFDICVGIVSAIVERVHDGEIEILVQTRWKPDRDPVYSGTLEIPAGGIKKYENVYDALQREVYEETGLKVLKIKPDIRTKMFSPRDDEAFAFVPFCGQQQTKGGVSRIGFVFICEVEDKPPVSQPEEVRDVRWMKTFELRQLLDENPEKIFTFQLGVLDYYLNHVRE
jgi:8-oxo-dGTP diphosphatase